MTQPTRSVLPPSVLPPSRLQPTRLRLPLLASAASLLLAACLPSPSASPPVASPGAITATSPATAPIPTTPPSSQTPPEPLAARSPIQGLAFPRLEQRLPAPAADLAPSPDAAAPADPVPGGSGEARPDCPGIAVRQGDALAIDGRPFRFFGINAPFLTEDSFPEREVEPILAQLSARGVNTVRVWFFYDQDPERFAGLLDAGARQGIRFVVTLADDVHKGVDWFFGEEDEARYRPHVQRTVERFRERPEILIWEPVNEPNCGDGRFDDACLETLRSWLNMMAKQIKAIDACRVVSTSYIGVGNFPNEREHFETLHGKDAIEVVSAHRRSTDDASAELDVAQELDKPIVYGEIYDEAFDAGCQPLSGEASPGRRAERIKDDLRAALADGVDGYLLWDLAPGLIRRTNGDPKDYCSRFGYAFDDPLWDKLLRSDPGLPPSVPWR